MASHEFGFSLDAKEFNLGLLGGDCGSKLMKVAGRGPCEAIKGCTWVDNKHDCDDSTDDCDCRTKQQIFV